MSYILYSLDTYLNDLQNSKCLLPNIFSVDNDLIGRVPPSFPINMDMDTRFGNDMT